MQSTVYRDNSQLSCQVFFILFTFLNLLTLAIDTTRNDNVIKQYVLQLTFSWLLRFLLLSYDVGFIILNFKTLVYFNISWFTSPLIYRVRIFKTMSSFSTISSFFILKSNNSAM